MGAGRGRSRSGLQHPADHRDARSAPGRRPAARRRRRPIGNSLEVEAGGHLEQHVVPGWAVPSGTMPDDVGLEQPRPRSSRRRGRGAWRSTSSTRVPSARSTTRRRAGRVGVVQRVQRGGGHRRAVVVVRCSTATAPAPITAPATAAATAISHGAGAAPSAERPRRFGRLRGGQRRAAAGRRMPLGARRRRDPGRGRDRRPHRRWRGDRRARGRRTRERRAGRPRGCRDATSARHCAHCSRCAASSAGSGSRRAARASCSGVQCSTVHLQPCP